MEGVFAKLRRLDTRGPTSRRGWLMPRGQCLGPTVCSSGALRRVIISLPRDEAEAIEKVLFGEMRGARDWLFDLSCGIGGALNAGETALAQIYGLPIPVVGLDDRQLEQLAAAAPFVKANFNPDEPRDARGRWNDGDGESENGGHSNFLRPASDITFGHGTLPTRGR